MWFILQDNTCHKIVGVCDPQVVLGRMLRTQQHYVCLETNAHVVILNMVKGTKLLMERQQRWKSKSQCSPSLINKYGCGATNIPSMHECCMYIISKGIKTLWLCNYMHVWIGHCECEGVSLLALLSADESMCFFNFSTCY